MRKFSAVIFLTVLIFSLTACGAKVQPPEETVKSFMAALVKADYRKLASLVDSNDSVSEIVNTPEGEEGQQLMEAIFSRIAYKVGASSVSGTNATVALSVTAPNLMPIVGLVFAEVIPTAFSLALSGAADAEEQIDALFMSSFMKHIKATDAPTVQTDTEVKLVLKNGSWLVVPDDALVNAITGNFQDAWAELQDGD